MKKKNKANNKAAILLILIVFIIVIGCFFGYKMINKSSHNNSNRKKLEQFSSIAKDYVMSAKLKYSNEILFDGGNVEECSEKDSLIIPVDNFYLNDKSPFGGEITGFVKLKLITDGDSKGVEYYISIQDSKSKWSFDNVNSDDISIDTVRKINKVIKTPKKMICENEVNTVNKVMLVILIVTFVVIVFSYKKGIIVIKNDNNKKNNKVRSKKRKK